MLCSKAHCTQSHIAWDKQWSYLANLSSSSSSATSSAAMAAAGC